MMDNPDTLMSDLSKPFGSPVLDLGRSPEQWADHLATRGVTVSSRVIRERAIAMGERHTIGRQSLITPDQMERILTGGRKRD